MDDKNPSLFIDTNCFLQMKDFNQINWRELFPNAEAIALVVCQAVISELDKHKVSTNRRRKDRARKALKQIEQAADQVDMVLPIREKAPKLNLVIWRGKPVWTDFPDLDPKSADDYLVAAASGTGDGIVFTHDTWPRIRARLSGVRATSPMEDWLLPAEQTDDQRQITQLKRELEASQNARPKLQIILPFDDPVTIQIWAVPPLGSDVAGKLADIILRAMPQEQVRVPPLQRYSVLIDPMAITQSMVDAYHQDYSAFASEVLTYFTTLHEKIERHARAQMMPGMIVNTGNVSARDITLEIASTGSLELLASRDDAESILGDIGLPEAPTPPRPRSLDYLPELARFPERTPLSPTAFYWAKRPDVIGATEAILECKDFRPGREEHLFALLRGRGHLPISGKVSVTISAEHHEAVCAERYVIFERGFGSWLHSDILALLPDLVQDAFHQIDPTLIPKW